MLDINEKSNQYETNSGSNSNTKFFEEDKSPADNENNMKIVLNNDIINKDFSNNDHFNKNNDKTSEKKNFHKNDNENDIYKITDNETDNNVDNDNNTYFQEISHNDEDVFYNKKYIYKSEENNEENNKEIDKVIEELKSFNLCDPKIDVLFKTIFKNEDLLLSLLNSIIPDEEHIDKIEYPSEGITFFPFVMDNKNKIIVDLHCKELYENYINKKNNSTNDEEKYKKHIIVEMQIKKKEDIVISVKVSITSFYRKRHLEFKSNMYTFIFLFYNYFDDDKCLHEVNSNSPKKKKDKKYQSKIYIAEIKKIRKVLKLENLKNLSKKVKDNKSKGIVDRKLEKNLKKQLWFAFLSKINVVYKKNREELEKNTENSEGGEEGKQKYKIYIRNDISPELYKLFKQDKDIMKAIDICKREMKKDDVDEHYRYVSSEEEIADSKNKNADLENKNADLENENADFKNKNADLENENADFKNKNAELRNQQKIQQENFMKTITMQENFMKMQENFMKTMKDKDNEIEKLNNKVNELRNQQKIQQDNFMKTQENFMKMQENFMKTMQENFMKTMQENLMKMMKDKDNEIENLKNELKRYRKDPEFNEKEVSKKKKLI